MILAIMSGHLKIVSYLLMNGALFDDSDSSSNSPLHYACAYGYYEMIHLLITAGANINIQNSWKYTPLGIAVAKKHFKIVN
jgi:ankyrin repeat protein